MLREYTAYRLKSLLSVHLILDFTTERRSLNSGVRVQFITAIWTPQAFHGKLCSLCQSWKQISQQVLYSCWLRDSNMTTLHSTFLHSTLLSLCHWECCMFITESAVCLSLRVLYVYPWECCMFIPESAVCLSLIVLYVYHWECCMFITESAICLPCSGPPGVPTSAVTPDAGLLGRFLSHTPAPVALT